MIEPDLDILSGRYPLLSYQDAAVTSAARFTWMCWSRQVGKSHALAMKRVRRAMKRRRLQVLLSAGERQSRELMGKVAAFCKVLDALASFQEVDLYLNGTTYKQLEITLPNGVRMIGLPANPDTARGFTGDVVLDEFGIHKHDREIWAALFPTVLRGEGELDVASTPKGLDNMFAQLRTNDRFERTTVTIEDAVAAGLPVDIDELREAMGDEELFRQEFLCEFLDDSSAFLSHAEILGVMSDKCPPPVRVSGSAIEAAVGLVESLVGEIDAAGWDVARRRDLSVIWLLKRIDGVLVTVGAIEMLDVPYRLQSMLLAAVMAAGCGRVCIDATGIGNPLAEEAAEAYGDYRIEPVMFTLDTKQRLAEPLRVAVQDKSILIPATDAIRNDWHSIQRSVTGDRIRYRSERTKDGHADRFWAAALAVRAATPTTAGWDGEVYGATSAAGMTRGHGDAATRRSNRLPRCV